MSDIKPDSGGHTDHSGLIVKPQAFTVELVIDNQTIKSAVGALNKESIISLLTIATSVNFPRLQGWNLYDERGTCIASVNAVDFIGKLAEGTPIGKPPADPKSAGWRAMPVVTPTSEGFTKMLEAAKKEGKIPT